MFKQNIEKSWFTCIPYSLKKKKKSHMHRIWKTTTLSTENFHLPLKESSQIHCQLSLWRPCYNEVHDKQRWNHRTQKSEVSFYLEGGLMPHLYQMHSPLHNTVTSKTWGQRERWPEDMDLGHWGTPNTHPLTHGRAEAQARVPCRLGGRASEQLYRNWVPSPPQLILELSIKMLRPPSSSNPMPLHLLLFIL